MITIDYINNQHKNLLKLLQINKNHEQYKSLYNIISNEKGFYEFKHSYLPCKIIRWDGNLNGYVGVPKDHIIYNERYNDNETIMNIKVHGKISYSNFLDIKDINYNDYWYLGFNTKHMYDYNISLHINSHYTYNNNISTYKNYTYVRRETEKLAEFLFKIDKSYMRKIKLSNILNYIDKN